MSPRTNLLIAIVMDPVHTIKPKKDSTVAMIRAAHDMGATLFYMGADDLIVQPDGVMGNARVLTPTSDLENWCSLGPAEWRRLNHFDAVLMRKDPPVDKRFIHSCMMLEQAKREGARVINNPATLINRNEKLFALQFPDLCPPTVVGSDHDALRAFLDLHQKIIIKPLDAMGGAGVFMVNANDVNFDVIWEIQTARGTYPVMAQKFIPAIAQGDARVVVINGTPFDHVLVRVPKPGSIRGNLAAGGDYTVRTINENERMIAERVGKKLQDDGIVFAGLDIIGDRLIEINITSPTGLQEITRGCGIDVAALLMQKILEG